MPRLKLGHKELVYPKFDDGVAVIYEVTLTAISDLGAYTFKCSSLSFTNFEAEPTVFTERKKGQVFLALSERVENPKNPTWLPNYPYYSFDKKTRRFSRTPDDT